MSQLRKYARALTVIGCSSVAFSHTAAAEVSFFDSVLKEVIDSGIQLPDEINESGCNVDSDEIKELTAELEIASDDRTKATNKLVSLNKDRTKLLGELKGFGEPWNLDTLFGDFHFAIDLLNREKLRLEMAQEELDQIINDSNFVADYEKKLKAAQERLKERQERLEAAKKIKKKKEEALNAVLKSGEDYKRFKELNKMLDPIEDKIAEAQRDYDKANRACNKLKDVIKRLRESGNGGCAGELSEEQVDQLMQTRSF